jgi:hypothetical protein
MTDRAFARRNVEHAAIAQAVGARRALVRCASAVAGGLLLAAPASAIELDEVTAVTLARDGSWGVATAGSTGEAIAAVVRACRAMAAALSDCGAVQTTTRGRWVVGSLCGDRQIIVSADSREDAVAAALERERATRRFYVPDLPPCRRVLTVDPGGAIAVAEPFLAERVKAEPPFR